MRERVQRDQLGGDLAVECDVVVIGTGAGGAVVGRELAEAGLAVVFVEEGAVLRPHATSPAARSRCSRSCTAAAARRSRSATSAIPIPLGQTVGGIDDDQLGHLLPHARSRARASGSASSASTSSAPEQHGAATSSASRRCSASSRAKAELLGGNGRVIARGCDALGFTQHGPLQRNAPECDGQGVCCFGCPTDAKRSTNVSYIPLALRAGAELFTGREGDARSSSRAAARAASSRATATATR